MKPTVSVIINTYNRAALLCDRAIKSIRNQTFKDWELIIVDDGSTDDTEERVKELIKQDKRIRYYKQKNAGAPAARNMGIGHACGEFIAFTDDDDEYLPECLAAGVEALRGAPKDIACVSGGAYIKDDVGVTSYIDVPLEPFWRSPVGNGWMFRAEVLKRFLFDPTLKAEDLNLRLRLEAAGYHPVRLRKPLRIYYVGLQRKPAGRAAYSTDMSHHTVAFEQFFARHEVDYKKYGNEALAWLYSWGGFANMRGEDVARGEEFFWKSFRTAPTVARLLWLAVSLLGYEGFRFVDHMKNRVMRLFRSAAGFVSPPALRAAYKKSFLNRWFPSTPEWYRRELLSTTRDVSSILDIGCGHNSFVRYADPKIEKVGVDVFDPYLEESAAEKIHDEYVQQDIRDLSRFRDKSFDMAMASDVIEHLTKEEGWKLIREMERIARKRVVVYTPNGFRPQAAYDGNAMQEHKSGWTIPEFKQRGYVVRGMDGWKFLKKEEAKIRFWPEPFWTFVSYFSQRFVYNHPRFAHALFCVKTLR